MPLARRPRPPGAGHCRVATIARKPLRPALPPSDHQERCSIEPRLGDRSGDLRRRRIVCAARTVPPSLERPVPNPCIESWAQIPWPQARAALELSWHAQAQRRGGYSSREWPREIACHTSSAHQAAGRQFASRRSSQSTGVNQWRTSSPHPVSGRSMRPACGESPGRQRARLQAAHPLALTAFAPGATSASRARWLPGSGRR
jgi:hypothetical protein